MGLKLIFLISAGGLAMWLYHKNGASAGMIDFDPATISAITADLRDSNGKPAPPQTLKSAKRIVLYFSASWCPPCRAFTPQLVSFYNTHGGGKDFQLIFVSNDQSAEAMQGYMQADNMPWWGTTYHSKISMKLAKAYEGPGIPCLVLLDRFGKVLADSTSEGRAAVVEAIAAAH
jgi:nucleoredoxin